MEIRALRRRVPARHDLVILAVAIIAVGRPVEGPFVWIVAGILLATMLVGTLQVLGDVDDVHLQVGVPVESLITPSVAAVACLGAIHLVPLGVWLVPALLASAYLVNRTIATEMRVLGSPHGPSGEDRSTILVEVLVVGFLGFTGVATLVPGGFPEPGAAPGGGSLLGAGNLLVLAAMDALIAGLLGYRASALRMTSLRDVLWSAATYALVIAIGAAALRAMDIPRLIGPALLTLVFFLWDAFHGAAPSRRRDPRWIWQVALLAVLGVVVAAWNLRLP
jgi:hypothetical protein